METSTNIKGEEKIEDLDLQADTQKYVNKYAKMISDLQDKRNA